ncbi:MULTISPECIES: carbamoyl-phosphate synthase large subunit [Zunongwangia]|jgi:carbamoyl-phosphate synthase large subunit|uniref:Carbamoyl-phosphate synthase large subunit n=4 Tax=Zunongwangia profunda TaxID=398743 RepID=D5BAL0_ZUNPS|nr:carbamoyl-phosphate synthase large subunit [Zunongwangia profunda]MAC65266.1 carbamoyl-phosphate synthase large subunit [Flavobacteriaceae bacterium]MAS69265.1 carbamoyl-phosphate synthase large subunit [Zunongwangia sp.]ADF52373.1 carbamoyl-phosphate synthase large subunit [Zunongwangia profunda SM-A87]MCC4228014.1 carbamoyl-phosphate synthase large subunit [Zunongwangia profunda]HCV80159.1 carbamoyl-phosphate synthase large subunit [Zunongwangia profunda]|tara:strand:+ start:2363 stop:5215 length:2853 start_codon:yes stop_codon:yes gene_type:complete
MPKNNNLKSILIIGSGPIVIGQACEFDYSGTQSLRSLREDGIETILINSNPATIMTDPSMADHVYLKPLTTKSIIEILEAHPNIDAVLPTMGGQTALNLCIEADDKGIWKDYDVKLIGVDIDAINITEDREQFKQLMERIGIPVAPAKTVTSYLQGKEVAQEFGFPLVIRASFTLGGSGAGFVHKAEDFDEMLTRGLEASPIHEVLIDKALLGWKEYELELLRDKNDNVVIICTIENMDPMGIHTGDSITVAPAMTLSDSAFQRMRDLAIKMMRSIGDFAGGCNVQFAVSPDEKEEIYAIEINPRVSRSSALASKATGYPIAKIATKLALGYTLDELDNQITQSTSALFEPSLDYVIVKIPRWNFDKFEGSDRTLGLQMKAVGEVMGIGRSFQEALHKATQSLEIKRNGLGADGKGYTKYDEIIEKLTYASWDRVFVIYDAIQAGIPLSRIHEITKIDMWFLKQYEELYMLEKEISTYDINSLPKDLMLEAKQKGFADRQIAYMVKCLESEVYNKRSELDINRVYKLVDTCAAEFKAETPYYYSTFEAAIETADGKKYTANESVVTDRKKIVVLGSGPNRIGQGIEFDYSCVHGVLAAAECGYETIMINCNPETVSTDFDVADKLYFEPVFWEHIYDIIRHEKPEGVIVQLGGQTALKLAEKLERYGIKIIGTSFEALDLAEDRGSFSTLLQKNDIPYPEFGTAENAEEALKLADQLDFPILVRPSYVLGGQGMKIVINKQELEETVVDLLRKIPNNKLLLDHYLDGAIEAEADAICDGEDVYIIGIMEHIEPCGIHSGDSNALLPPFTLGDLVLQQIKDHTRKIALALNTVGLINIQFAIKEDKVYIIEANPRASRTVPFIAKAYKEPYVNYATKVMLGDKKIKDFTFNPQLDGYAIKQPVFSFEKFHKVNKQLGPEMKSTGESILFIKDLKDDDFYNLYTRRKMYLSK